MLFSNITIVVDSNGKAYADLNTVYEDMVRYAEHYKGDPNLTVETMIGMIKYLSVMIQRGVDTESSV